MAVGDRLLGAEGVVDPGLVGVRQSAAFAAIDHVAVGQQRERKCGRKARRNASPEQRIADRGIKRARDGSHEEVVDPSMMLIETVSAATAVEITAPRASPPLISGMAVRPNPNMYASRPPLRSKPDCSTPAPSQSPCW
jgi:hypothetical protein